MSPRFHPMRLVLLAGGMTLSTFGIALFVLLGFSRGMHSLAAASNVAVGVLLVLVARASRRARAIRMARLLAVVLGSVLVFADAVVGLIEVDETVVLRTFDERGRVFETRLWVADFRGSTWVGAGAGTRRRWLRQLIANPEVELVREGVTGCYIAVPVEDAGAKAELLRFLDAKYPWGQLASALGNAVFFGSRGDDPSIPIRLDPCARSGAVPLRLRWPSRRVGGGLPWKSASFESSS